MGVVGNSAISIRERCPSIGGVSSQIERKSRLFNTEYTAYALKTIFDRVNRVWYSIFGSASNHLSR